MSALHGGLSDQLHQLALRFLPSDDLQGLPFPHRQFPEDDVGHASPHVSSRVDDEEANHDHLLAVPHDQQLILLDSSGEVGRFQPDAPRRKHERERRHGLRVELRLVPHVPETAVDTNAVRQVLANGYVLLARRVQAYLLGVRIVAAVHVRVSLAVGVDPPTVREVAVAPHDREVDRSAHERQVEVLRAARHSDSTCMESESNRVWLRSNWWDSCTRTPAKRRPSFYHQGSGLER